MQYSTKQVKMKLGRLTDCILSLCISRPYRTALLFEREVMIYQTWKYNNANSHFLDQFNNLEDAKKSALSLHHPDWSCWQRIVVYEYDTCDSAGKKVFDSDKKGK